MDIINAIESKKTLRFAYSSGSRKGEVREVICVSWGRTTQNNLLLISYDLGVRKIRKYLSSRITGQVSVLVSKEKDLSDAVNAYKHLLRSGVRLNDRTQWNILSKID